MYLCKRICECLRWARLREFPWRSSLNIWSRQLHKTAQISRGLSLGKSLTPVTNSITHVNINPSINVDFSTSIAKDNFLLSKQAAQTKLALSGGIQFNYETHFKVEKVKYMGHVSGGIGRSSDFQRRTRKRLTSWGWAVSSSNLLFFVTGGGTIEMILILRWYWYCVLVLQ